MKQKYLVPENLRLATENDFRKNGRLKLGVNYWYYCFGERKLVTHKTNAHTDIPDLKDRISHRDVYMEQNNLNQ